MKLVEAGENLHWPVNWKIGFPVFSKGIILVKLYRLRSRLKSTSSQSEITDGPVLNFFVLNVLFELFVLSYEYFVLLYFLRLYFVRIVHTKFYAKSGVSSSKNERVIFNYMMWPGQTHRHKGTHLDIYLTPYTMYGASENRFV